MAEFRAGPTMVASWVTASYGTISIAPDYRTCSIKTNVDVIDATAGADTSKVKMFGMQDITVDMNVVLQAGGTANMAAFQTSTQGTLTIQPEGTATGKTKFTVPSFVSSSYEYPYNDIAVATLTFNGMGAFTVSTN